MYIQDDIRVFVSPPELLAGVAVAEYVFVFPLGEVA